MKNQFILFLICFELLCVKPAHSQTSYVVESFIKTMIEAHVEGEFSSVKIKNIDLSQSLYSPSFEWTAYKYSNLKGLILCVSGKYTDMTKPKAEQVTEIKGEVIELNLKQCQAILENYKILLEKLNMESPILNEKIYHDYAVSKDLFISYEIYGLKKNKTPGTVKLWVKGVKYEFSTERLIRILNEFISY